MLSSAVGCTPKAGGDGSGGSSASGGTVGSGGSGTGGSSSSGGNSATGGSGSGGNGSGGNGSGGNGSGGSGSGGSTASGGRGGSGSGGTTSSGGTTGAGGSSSSNGGSGAGTGGTAGSGKGGSGSGGSGSGGTGTSSGGGGGTASDPGIAPSAISGLSCTANPNSVISCFCSWTTDQASNSSVQFGAGSLQWQIDDTTLVTSHKVLVIGMHAQTSYMIKAISANSGGQATGTTTFMTGTLPAQIPNGTVMINDTTRSQPGWTLMNVQKGDGMADARSTYPPYAVMYDSGGLPVWYYVDGTMPDIGGAVSTVLTDKGVLIGPSWNSSANVDAVVPIEVDFAGNTVWQCPSSVCGNKNFTHHASKLSNGDYMLIEYVTTNNVQNPIFREVSPTSNSVVWSLDYSKFVTPPSGATGDWCHANSITVDIAKDVVYANCRWQGLLKTSYTNPARQWLLQASQTFVSRAPGDFTFSGTSSTTPGFSDTHDPEIHDDGTFCFFDNGGYASGATGGTTTMFHSRAVEYQVDENAKTATLIWEFPGNATVPDSWYTSKWYTPFWGDVDRLPNGNFLVTGGIRSTTVESRVFEVTKSDRQVVWEFRFPTDYGVYRSDRITPPLIHAISSN
jgi:hypothetical protein